MVFSASATSTLGRGHVLPSFLSILALKEATSGENVATEGWKLPRQTDALASCLSPRQARALRAASPAPSSGRDPRRVLELALGPGFRWPEVLESLNSTHTGDNGEWEHRLSGKLIRREAL